MRVNTRYRHGWIHVSYSCMMTLLVHMACCMNEVHARWLVISTWLAACFDYMCGDMSCCYIAGCMFLSHESNMCFCRLIPCQSVACTFWSLSSSLVLLGPFPWFWPFRYILNPRSIPNILDPDQFRIFSTPILMNWIFLINSRLNSNRDDKYFP